MRLLTATRETQGQRDDDYDDGTIEGELVEPAVVCDRDLHDDRDNECGCGRSFIALTSRAMTTTAKVVDIAINYDQLRDIIAGIDRDIAADPEDIDALATDLIAHGDEYPEGTIVGIWRYELHERQ